MDVLAYILLFIVDVMKAFISVKTGYIYCGAAGAMTAFACVVLGHCFPVFFGFKGGKGVAAAFGAALALNWMSACLALLVAGLLFLVTRRMSVASIVAVLTYPVLIWFFDARYVYFAVAAAAFLVIMHAANIKRIAKGEEKPLTIGGRHNSEDEEQKK